MISKESRVNFLLTKYQLIEKRKNKAFIFQFVVPVIYFLFGESIIDEFGVYGATLHKEMVVLLTPFFYSLLMLYSSTIFHHYEKLYKQIQNEVKEDEKAIFFVEKIKRFTLLDEVVGVVHGKGIFRWVWVVLVAFPLVVVMVLLPTSFFIFSFNNLLNLGYENIELVVAFVSIWVYAVYVFFSVSTLFYDLSKSKKE